MILVFLVFSAPIVASYIAYYWLPPAGRVNYGEILSAAPLPDANLRTVANRQFQMSELKGKWILLQVDSGACAAECQEKLALMRQIRLALGKEQGRIERVFLIDDATAPHPLFHAEYTGTWFVRASGSPFLNDFPAHSSTRDHVYLIDPLGNLVLRYPSRPDARKMIKDLQRLLKVSRIG